MGVSECYLTTSELDVGRGVFKRRVCLRCYIPVGFDKEYVTNAITYFLCKHLCAFVQEKIEAFVKSTHGILLSMLGNSTHKPLDDVLTFNVYLLSCLFCL